MLGRLPCSTFFSQTGLTLLLVATLSSVLASGGLAQSSTQLSNPSPSPTPTASPTEPQVLTPSGPGVILLSKSGGQQLMTEATTAVSAQNYPVAIQKLQQAREIFNQLSNFYQELAASFSGVDNKVADIQRRKALESALLRDQSTYQLALVHRAQNKPELAVPLLVQIIRSQQPTRDLGQKAYQQLFELGFVEAPFPATPDAAQPPAEPQQGKKKR
jgi:hypothetical protein